MWTIGSRFKECSRKATLPGRSVGTIELLLDVRRDVLLDIVLCNSLNRRIDCLVLHLLGHVDVLNDGLLVTHFESWLGSGSVLDDHTGFESSVTRQRLAMLWNVKR